jgi:hypothetical protein
MPLMDDQSLWTEAGHTKRTLLSCAICNARIGVLTAQCSASRTRFTWREHFDRVAQFVLHGWRPALVLVKPDTLLAWHRWGSARSGPRFRPADATRVNFGQ